MDPFHTKTLAAGQLVGAKPSLRPPVLGQVPVAGTMGAKKVKKTFLPCVAGGSPLGTLKAKCADQLRCTVGLKPKLAAPFAPPTDPLERLCAASGITIGQHRVWEDIPL
jgi:hypothetical protein